MSDYGWNNGIGSYSCGKNIRLDLYDLSDAGIGDFYWRVTSAAGKLDNYDTYLVHGVVFAGMSMNENNQYMNIFNSEDCSHASWMFGYSDQDGHT